MGQWSSRLTGKFKLPKGFEGRDFGRITKSGYKTVQNVVVRFCIYGSWLAYKTMVGRTKGVESTPVCGIIGLRAVSRELCG